MSFLPIERLREIAEYTERGVSDCHKIARGYPGSLKANIEVGALQRTLTTISEDLRDLMERMGDE